MGKQQVWSVTAYVFLFLSLVSQIYCTSQRGIDSSGEAINFNTIRRGIRLRSLQTTTTGASQKNRKERDLIQKLYGQPSVSFKQYGGYVPVNEKADRFLYYYFVEAINANASTPLLIWFNGGPGCSSMSGAFKELGPFRINSDGKTLYLNPYAWNNEVNVLFIESPVGVGFSYSDIPLDYKKEGEGGDKRTANENYKFLLNWLKRFPEYKGRELFISGQSYAGHYVPQLAQLILQNNNKTFINLRGVLMGNAALDNKAINDGVLEFMVGHSLIPQEFVDDYKKLCHGIMTEECINASVNIEIIKKYLDEYNIYAPKCKNKTLSSKPNQNATVMKYEPCSSHYMKAYLNIEKAQKAMRANNKNKPLKWEQCNYDLVNNWNMNDYKSSMIPILQELMNEGVRVWLYSGNLDLAVPFTSTINVLKLMNLTVEKTWSSWLSGKDVGGNIETYKGNLTFVTVRGAGHSVPTDQPIRALALFTSFVRNTLLAN